ncbi:MAG: hypothetical protein IIA48_11100 [Bacteroidetes bacterium]|nr:hypothetical protein [Bacteroidota bacterium]
MNNKITSARLKYKPEKIKYLFVAEAPPKEDSDRFFYFENVLTADSLFLETMKVLYPKDYTVAKVVRLQKKKFLEKFKEDEFYLIDSTDQPMENNSQSYKKNKIKEALPSLKEKIKNLVNEKTKIILISKPVYDVCFTPLINEGFNIVNTGMIDFPGSSGQEKFKEKLQKLLINYQ